MYMRILFLLLVFAGLLLRNVTASDADPAEVVQRFESVLLSVMQDAAELGYSGRHQRLSPIVREYHDFPTIARVVAGKHWKHLDAGQRMLLKETFTELSVSTYAGQFDGYSGERFEFLSQRRYRDNRALVRAVLLKPGGKQRDFDYMLQRFNGMWRIVNITVDGVSDLALKRVEFQDIIEQEGFDALIRKLREKIALYEAEG